jgi:hypothetical protein
MDVILNWNAPHDNVITITLMVGKVLPSLILIELVYTCLAASLMVWNKNGSLESCF